MMAYGTGDPGRVAAYRADFGRVFVPRRDVRPFVDAAAVVPTLIAAVSVVLMHLFKRSTIASIAVGTAVYMILIRVI